MVRPRCIVSYCENLGRHKFPKDEERRNQWIEAIEHVKPKMTINAYSGVCSDHFRLTDFSVVPSYWNNYYSAKILKKSAVPSVFKWNKTSEDEEELIEEPSSSIQDTVSFNPERVKATYSREMGKSRAEYMRDYRQKKREEKLKSGELQIVKRIPRSSTQRSRDFRARLAILSKASAADPTSALPNSLSPTPSTSTATACSTGPPEIHQERVVQEDVEFHVDQKERDEISHFPSGEKTTLRRILVQYLGYKFKKCKNARTILIQKPDIAACRARYLRRKKENNELGQTVKEKKPNNVASQQKRSLLKITKLQPQTNKLTQKPTFNIQNANTSCINRLKLNIENQKRFLPPSANNNGEKRLKLSSVPPNNSNIVGKVSILLPKTGDLAPNNVKIQGDTSRLPPNVVIKTEHDVETDFTDDSLQNNDEFIQDDGTLTSCLPLEVNIKTEDVQPDSTNNSMIKNDGFIKDDSMFTSGLSPGVNIKTEKKDESYTMIEVEVDMKKPIKQEINE